MRRILLNLVALGAAAAAAWWLAAGDGRPADGLPPAAARPAPSRTMQRPARSEPTPSRPAPPAPAPPEPTLTPVAAVARMAEVRRQVAAVRTCYRRDDCGLTSDRDPRARHFAEVSEVCAALDRARAAAGPATAAAVLELTRDLEAMDSDWVRARLLGLLDALPASDAAAQQLVDLTLRSADPSIHDQALDLLDRRYGGEAYRDPRERYLIAALERGGFNAGRRVAERLAGRIDASNAAAFRQLLERLPPSSTRHHLLKQSLEAFDASR